MKRILWRIVAVAVGSLVSLCLIVGIAQATERISGNTAVADAQVIDDDLLIGGNNVQVKTKVNGDVVAAGANVFVSGPVRDDVTAAGATVTVSAPVGDDLRAAGGTVTISNQVAHNAMLTGGTVVLEKGAKIGRDASIAAGSVEIQSPVTRNLAISAGEARLASEVGGSVEVRADRLLLQPGAVIKGDMVVYSPTAPEIAPGAKVLGQMDYRPIEATQGQSPVAGWFGNWLYRFLAFLLLALTLVAIGSRWIERVTDTMTRRLAPCFLTGFFSAVLIPVACLALLLTLVGIPLSVLLFTLYTVALLLSGVFVSYPLGGWLLRRMGRTEPSPYGQMTLGVLAVSFLTTLPFLGWVFQLFVVTVGFGAVLIERWTSLPPMRRHITVRQAAPAGGPA
jgi:hypothetical protein